MTGDITAHYSFGGLRERIESGLAQLGQEPTVEVLGAVDEFHVGGRAATEHLVVQLGLQPDSRVLDIGSGLGGLARFVASTTGAHVTGVDLTEEYVQVAAWLTDVVGLADRTSFAHGSTEEAASGSFTAATMVHVGMNIADKAHVFADVRRALEPGAPFGIYDILATGAARPQFPCPWAASSSTSFLETSDSYVAHLETAGFVVEAVCDRTSAAIDALDGLTSRASAPPAPLGLHLVMGPETRTKVRNMTDAVRNGVLAPTEIIATA